MSELRRRIGRVFSDSPSPSPSRDGTPDPGEEVQLVPVSKLKKLTTGKKSKRKSWLLFGLGGLFGLLLALFLAQQQEVIRLEGLMEVNLESFMDVIPAGIIRDAKDLSVRNFEVPQETPADRLRKQSAKLQITTVSQLAFISNRRASKPIIQLS